MRARDEGVGCRVRAGHGRSTHLSVVLVLFLRLGHLGASRASGGCRACCSVHPWIKLNETVFDWFRSHPILRQKVHRCAHSSRVRRRWRHARTPCSASVRTARTCCWWTTAPTAAVSSSTARPALTSTT